MSYRSRSDSRSSKKNRSPSPQAQHTKLFITNLDGKVDTKQLENELTRQFEKQGEIISLVVKRNRNSEYCFAFAEMKDHESAQACVKAFDQSNILGKAIKVEFQDDTKRRKDSNVGCYNCGKKGHFARECRAPRSDERGGYGRRDRSRSSRSSDSYNRRKKHKKRYRSPSSDRDRSYDRDRKRKRDYSRDRDEKKKKKHRKRSYS